ncbi:hypothetical protein DCC79_11055 [bacterium]|nr:MAG: hypothetical protein DCC79_11055 [bacterium]
MARKPQPRRRPPSPPPTHPVAGVPRSRPPAATAVRTTAASATMTAAPENLDESYAHVRRDLMRTTILMVLLLAGIYASQFVF